MIREIEFPEEMILESGLKCGAHLKDLGSLVILAGPNGAGKTRYLRVLENAVNTYNKYSRDNLDENLQAQYDELENLNVELEKEEKNSLKWKAHKEKVESGISNRPSINQNILAKYDESTKRHQELLAKRKLLNKRIKGNEERKKFESILKKYLKFSDSNKHSKCIWLQYDASVKEIFDPEKLRLRVAGEKLNQTHEGGLETIQPNLHLCLRDEVETIFTGNQADRDQALEFNRILNRLLGASLEVTGEVVHDAHSVVLYSRPFNQGELSEGQIYLISWAVTLHRQQQWLKDSIILLDEPENYLHPDACIRAIEELRKVVGPKTQIWIASHSVALLAYFGLESIYFVNDGKIDYAGNQIDRALRGLLGSDDGRERVQALLCEGEKTAFYRFCAQCLLQPKVAEAKSGDPQITQFGRLVDISLQDQVTLNILDYGAGNGRLAKALGQIESDGAKRPKINYYAYNQADGNAKSQRDSCMKRIEELRQPETWNNYYYEDKTRLLAEQRDKMHLIVMCNVLHEIPPADWASIFRDLHQLLMKGGCLIIMEDQCMPVGELPHDQGFLVLCHRAVKKLFNANGQVKMIDQMLDGRLTAIEVPRDVLLRISDTTISNALKEVEFECMNFIKDCYQQKAFVTEDSVKLNRLGRKLAFYSTLHCNVLLAKDGFKKVTGKPASKQNKTEWLPLFLS